MTTSHEYRPAHPEQSAALPKTEKPAKAPATFPAYARSKCLIGYGLINGIINALVFRLMYLGQESVTFDYAHVTADLAMTSVFIGIILFLCAVPLTKMDMRKGHFQLPATDGLATFMPRRYPLAVIVAGVIACVVTTGVVAIIAMVLPLPLGVIPMMVFKGIMCAFAGGVAGLFAIAYAIRANRPTSEPAA